MVKFLSLLILMSMHPSLMFHYPYRVLMKAFLDSYSGSPYFTGTCTLWFSRARDIKLPDWL